MYLLGKSRSGSCDGRIDERMRMRAISMWMRLKNNTGFIAAQNLNRMTAVRRRNRRLDPSPRCDITSAQNDVSGMMS